MTEHLLIGLASIIVLGVSAQWLAWRLRLPSILLLLLFGLVAGPVTGFIHPDALLGELLFPVVSLSVALILYEGGLSLRFRELNKVGGVVFRLISIGVLATWLVGALAAYYVLGLSVRLSVLIAAVLVVTGPTVIGPLLQQIRPKGETGPVLKWEGILIDPVGAVLAVLVFEAILAGEFQQAPLLIAQGVLVTALIGAVVGVVGAGIMTLLLKNYLIPDQLQNGVSLLLVTAAYTVADLLHPESGLLAVTVMGIVLANQRYVPVKHIIEFKENLREMLIAILFIILAARLQLADIMQIDIGAGLLFLAILIIVGRPLAVFLSTWGAGLSLKEKGFLSWMAPRGIVAAAVASIFSLRLAEAGFPAAEQLVPLVFFVIVGTVLIYGLTASPLARRLGIAEQDPQGVLLMGAHSLAQSIAQTLQSLDIPVRLIDSNWRNISEARMAGLSTHYGNALAEYVLDEIDLTGIGRFLALTPNDEANSLATLHFSEIFGRSEVYQLPINKEKNQDDRKVSPQHLRGRILFAPEMTHVHLMEWLEEGAQVKATPITAEFDYQSYLYTYGGSALSLFLLNEDGTLQVVATDSEIVPQPGQTLISLVRPAPSGSRSGEDGYQAHPLPEPKRVVK